jgi:lipoprotein-anchoring transpeptidase ErfK/SrfK
MGTALVQQRLLELGFWLYGVDGEYGPTTKQAVMAFQKWNGLDPTGSVNEATAAALTMATSRPVGQSTQSAVVVEIDKTKQVMLITAGGKLIWAINISSGSGQYYLELNQKDPTKWETGRSLTPSGKFKVQRERSEGWWDGDLGQIYRPKYFNGGIAIHGSKSIPNYPASHGCVRVSTAAMDMIWASGLVPLKTAVWVYGEDIEAEGEPPVIPTTTTTTTPAVTTTLAPISPAPPDPTTIP